MHRTLPILALVAFLQSCELQQSAVVTPQRPTVSFDTATTREGSFELETGIAIEPDTLFDSPNTLKYGASQDTELFVGWSPWQRVAQPGQDAEGSSDLVLGTRHRLFEAGEGTPSGAFVMSGKLPTASVGDGLGSGELDLRLGVILNQQIGSVNTNLFYQYGALGNPDGAGFASEQTATLTAGVPLSERFAAFAEVGGTFVPARDTRALFSIVGASLTASTQCVIDSAVFVGLSNDAPDVQLYFGCTYNLGSIKARPVRP
ncbi:MAG: hypothetical protein H6832_12160 [Planctomycetes bacterium]|nr:hypothetical protein [Planctomycetota bacterium]MCB9891001.1 hypothetical protein [Planctomycetota bacterium]MCB9919146.1 hypothetical protein [Planctomycetota bacterium]